MKKRPTEKKQPDRPPAPHFLIVGVGASAGGLQAFLQFVEGIPEHPGFALIFILHTDGRDSSSLRDVIARKSKVPVEVAVAGEPIEIDRIYIPPPRSNLLVDGGRFHVQPRTRSGAATGIDACFVSLAQNQGPQVVGVVLSGTAADGTAGAKAIREQGGITFAQDDSAQNAEMPRNAALAGAIDFILPPQEIGREIVRIAQQSAVVSRSKRPLSENDLTRVLDRLRSAHHVDFTHYKPSTIERRIRRRMSLRHVQTFNDYVALLDSNPAEVQALYNDVLIRVTAFFRDPEVFDFLCTKILPPLASDRAGHDPVRMWVPGCSTGEEVYSLAMCMIEAMESTGESCPIQIFGTDVSETAMQRARAGLYPADIEAEVSEQRLQRFFVKVENGYRVSKALRDCCIFARQDLTKDPPFSRLDLISCRNVMIYLGATLQRRVMSILHYALRPKGYLLLGSSESIGNFGDLFVDVDRTHKLYMKSARASPLDVRFEPMVRPEAIHKAGIESESPAVNVFREADRVLLSRYSPPGVVVNENMDILQFRGRVSAFLEPAPGAATLNLYTMAREGLLSELRAAIHTARKKDAPVRREGIPVVADGGSIMAAVDVIPFRSVADEPCFIILFEALPDGKKAAKTRARKSPPETESRQVLRLKSELESTREYLQSIVEDQESMNEALRSANEEIQSSNEELQSANEELETAKEELQSSNEELTTLNEELENRNNELAELNNDLVNLLSSVEIPIVMLDTHLRIRRFNPSAERVLNFIPSDMGRPITDLKMAVDVGNLSRMIRSVIANLEVREMRVRHPNGQWYSLRIRPYKTLENKIEGAVLIFVDVDDRKRKQRPGVSGGA